MEIGTAFRQPTLDGDLPDYRGHDFVRHADGGVMLATCSICRLSLLMADLDENGYRGAECVTQPALLGSGFDGV